MGKSGWALGLLAPAVLTPLLAGSYYWLGLLHKDLRSQCPPFLPTGSTTGAAVVLGYGLERNGSLTLPLQQRVQVGLALYEAEQAVHLIFSGGHPGGGIRVHTEAQAMAEYAMQLAHRAAVPARWLLEGDSTSTRQNAVFSLRLAAAQGITSIAVVTNRFHQLRAGLVFQCAAREQQAASGQPLIQVWQARVPPEGSRGKGPVMDLLWELWDSAREVAALAWYWLRGWLC